MSKTTSQDLFILIKSLNKNEKGYVKKVSFQRNNEDLNFIKLFNAIDKQKDYDEEALLKNETYIAQLPRLKNYLYDHILECLIGYYSKNNIDIVLRKMMGQVQVLYEKGLYEQCLKQLKRSKELAQGCERLICLLEILDWERQLSIEKMLVNDFDLISEEEKKINIQLIDLSFYKTSYQEISRIYSEVIYIRNLEQNERFLKILLDERFTSEIKAHTITAKIFYYKCKCKYYAALDDRKKYLHYALKAVALIESNSRYLEQDLLQYIKLLNNLAATLSEHSMIDEYKECYNKMKNLLQNFPQAKTEKMSNIINVRILIRDYFHAFDNGLYEESLMYALEIEKLVESKSELLGEAHLTMFNYHVAYTYFIMGDFKSSLKCVNDIICLSLSPDKIFFICLARMLSMIIHIELNNLDVLTSQLISNERFFKKINLKFELETTIFKFVSKYLGTGLDKHERDMVFTQLINSLKTDINSLDIKMLDYFDYEAWAIGKIKKNEMRKFLKKKAK